MLHCGFDEVKHFEFLWKTYGFVNNYTVPENDTVSSEVF